MDKGVSYKIVYFNFILAIMVVGIHGITANSAELCGTTQFRGDCESFSVN